MGEFRGEPKSKLQNKAWKRSKRQLGTNPKKWSGDLVAQKSTPFGWSIIRVIKQQLAWISFSYWWWKQLQPSKLIVFSLFLQTSFVDNKTTPCLRRYGHKASHSLRARRVEHHDLNNDFHNLLETPFFHFFLSDLQASSTSSVDHTKSKTNPRTRMPCPLPVPSPLSI